MPRKTKEQKELENENKVKKVEPKSSTKKVASTTKKSVATKKSTTTSSTAKKKTSTTTTKTKKKVDTEKLTTKKTTTTKKSTPQKTTAKKATTKTTATTKKATTKKIKSSQKKGEIVEYYDLPYRYNQTVVKVLAQTPTNLFIYWDISEKDRKSFKKQYGDDFFETTKPILIVYNDTLGYSFEVEINDFANSWYLHVADSKCDYRIELGRRPIVKHAKINMDYIYVTTSNEIEAPNNRILFDKNQKMVYFKNIKTGQLTGKTVSSISFIRNMGKINTIHDLYQQIYQAENTEEIFNLSNPSSGSFHQDLNHKN